ncbi:VOC family protein [Conexibacter stalactiti]|uniref:VOC family protein n=1 Tax=Conexibacter stalactiti TaxID=1940611 RepID=A0ABU4HNI4_9ACTN|nr:VOC family protein [Conexibacter stalactiti]MDW5594872.1 VOC family protein [Conexibacter stalactiti]MEC5035514.1 VOC family protein [Conexibacter stalactiti]
MPVSEVHHVAMSVSDLERAATFYERALGYRRTLSARVGGPEMARSLALPQDIGGSIQYMQGPSQIGQLELIQWDDGPGEPPRVGHLHLGTFLLSFQVPVEELEELHAAVEANGGSCIDRPTQVLLENYGHIHAFAARDPDGNLLEFVSLPSREQIKAYREQQAAAAGEPAPASAPEQT